MKSTPRCALRLSDRLEELKRRENLERLRAPLIEHSLFPHGKDGQTATITVEELKKLVRQWKLHEVRGFWKTHPEKEDLIRALLNHMDDMDEIYNYDKVVPVRPTEQIPQKKRHVGRILKPYSGDLFGHTENTDGIIYLSRYDTKKVDLKSAPSVFGQGKKFNSFVDKSFFENDGKSKDYDSDNDSDTIGTKDSIAMNERRIGIAEQLYKYSTCPGIEKNMIAEGTVEALDDFAHMDDPRALNCCAAILANLTVERSLCPEILESGIITDVIQPLNQKANLTDIAKRGLAYTLYRFSLLEDKVLSVFRECSDCLMNLIKSEDEETKMCAAAALVNVTGAMVVSFRPGQVVNIGGDDRQRIVEQVMPFLKELCGSPLPHVRLAVARAFKNFSMYENARLTMVEAGCCESLLKLISYPEIESYRIDVITAVANLTNAVDGRERMIKDGIVSCIFKLGNDGDTTENKKLVACAMANLTGVSKDMIGHVVMNGAAKSLVSLCKVINEFDDADTIDIRVAAGLANLTVHEQSILKLIASDVHTSLMILAKDEGVASLKEAFDMVDSDGQGAIDVAELRQATGALGLELTQSEINQLVEIFDKDDSGQLEFPEFKLLIKYQAEHGASVQLHTRQVLVAIGLCNLLSDFNTHETLHKAGVIDVVRRLTEINDKEVNLYCAKALSNLVANPKMRNKVVQAGVFEEWMELIDRKDMECCKVCGNALVHMTASAMFQTTTITYMIDNNILDRVHKMIEMKDKYLYFYCATILCNLVVDESNHDRLIKNGILDSIDTLTMESVEAETKIRCGAALERLSSSLSTDHSERLVNSLSLLLNNTSDASVTHYISVAFFSLSSRPEVAPLLARSEEIHKLLISMMRGAPGETQIHGAKALCNLTCDEECSRLLLKTGHVSDFVVIAILRTNSPLIKEICSQSLFNLLHHESLREQMVETGVLWAILKLSKLDSKQTQNICAKVLFNFSCYDANMKQKIMEHGVPRLLSIATIHDAELEDPETKQFCAGALCNLAFRPEAGALYAKGGAIGFMKELMDIEDDDNEMYCATILYNLSHCEIDSRLTLVHENAVPLLINLSKSTKERTIIASLGSSLLLSLCIPARRDMVSEDLAPALIRCVSNTDNLVLVILGISSLYHLTCGVDSHDGESVIELVKQTSVVEGVCSIAGKYKDNEFIVKICSRIILNFALEESNHMLMIDGGVLETIEMFFGMDREVLENARKCFSVFSNTESVLGGLLGHATFDTYCEQMLKLGGESNLTFLSQVLYNTSRVAGCCLPLVQKSYYENCIIATSLKNPLMNTLCVKTIKIMVDSPTSKDLMMKSNCAGVLSRVSQATKDADLKQLCGKILNSMSNRKSTVTYSEGSIVAVLSTFEEPDSDEEGVDLKPVAVVIDEMVPEILDESVVEIPKIAYKAAAAKWSLFVQSGSKDVKPLPASPEMQALILNPPRVFTLQTNGCFEKIDVPGLGKLLVEDIELLAQTNHVQREQDQEAALGGG
ncbi:hypothetical protein TrLO_g10818 [Triparma laevis f. longispina]|uniref:Vacuolar protein 8 n=1 Tax=Triparma laevis f. longispina TaxID=1714387 RepID=A0A9W7KZZ2_9STRA|nr:hypothetical protein TrLO_g10818 [Triparma laevis f. longispina]